MYDIPNDKPSKEFIECFKIAGKHLQQYFGKCTKKWMWLKATPFGPHLEHLSFFLGNQAFFIQLIDSDGKYDFPGTSEGLQRIADGYGGHACFMPMHYKKGFFKSGWQPTLGGCGLVDAHSGKPIEPNTLVTDEPVPMSSWELHDFAIQVVRQSLEKEGKQILSWSSDPDVNPSLWFQKGNQRAWVVVRGYKYPALSAEIPENLSHMKDELMRRGYSGYYAEVGFANADNIHKAIMRGDGCIPKYTGLQNLPEPTPKRNAMNPSGSKNAELLRTNTFKNLLILGRRRGIFNGEKTASFIPDLVYSAHIIAEQVKKEFPPFVNANSVTMLSWLNVAFTHACWIGVGAAYQWRYEREQQDDLGIYEALIHKTDFSNIPLYVKELTKLDKESDFLISESFKDITKHLTQGLIECIQQAPERLDVEILERISLAFLYGSSVAQAQL